MNRDIKFIVIHSTQTEPNVSIETIRENWKRNEQRPVFHCVIDAYGHAARMLGTNFAAQQNFPQNENCFHIAYIGGLDRSLSPTDTRNPLQTHILFEKIEELQNLYPNAVVIGYGEFSGQNNPGFDVTDWMHFYATHREDWVEIEVEDETEETEEEWLLQE